MSKLEENLELQKTFSATINKFYDDRKDRSVITPVEVDGLYTGLNALILLDISESLAMIADSLSEKKPRSRTVGYWNWKLADNGWADHICSECGFKENTDIHVKLNWGYCPKCGCKMISKQTFDLLTGGDKDGVQD